MHVVETTTSAVKPQKGAKAQRRSPYLTPAQTEKLVASSLAARQQRLAAGDMVSTEEAAELTGTSRVTINAWIAKGRAVGLTQSRRGYRLPRWQFEPELWKAMPELSNALRTAEGWALLNFLETPQGGLDGLTPRQAIEQGKLKRVIALAKAEGT